MFTFRKAMKKIVVAFAMQVAVLAALLALPQMAQAQNDITVVTQVLPPYSPYLSDYANYQNKMVITLINTTQKKLDVRLVATLKGQSNNIVIKVPQNYNPAQPITLAPGQNKQLMGVQLKEYLNPDILEMQGITKQELVLGNGLPEGGYSMCVQAFQYQSNTALSQKAPSGCADFTITHVEPPMLQQPTCDAKVQKLNPQNVFFTWTAPAGTLPNKVQYVLKVVEMIPQNINPNQAMQAATDPPFFQKTIATNSYLFGANDPQLQEGKKYAVRVTVQNVGNSSEYYFKNGGNSVVCAFSYGAQQNNNNNNNNDVDEQYADNCAFLNCAPQPLAQGPAGNAVYKNGDEVLIGYFTLKLTNVSNGAASNLSGEGEIDMPLFKIKLKAEFTGLKVNAQHKVFSGKARGAYDPGAQVTNEFKDFTNKVDNIIEDKVKNITDYVKSQNKYTDKFLNVNGGQTLPFAFSKMVDLDLQFIDIVAIEFAPDGARLNAVMNFTIPEAQNKILAFAQKNVCFHPTGLSVDGLQKLTMLGTDKTINWGAHKLVIKAATGNNNGTFIRWDCSGYKDLQVQGEFQFDNSKIVKAEGGGNAKAIFTASAGRWGDLLATVTMDDFAVKGVDGLRFDFSDVVFDFSDKRNADGMSFPASYNGSKAKDWRGFAFKNITVTLPDYLQQKGKNITVALKNFLIDKQGFSGAATVKPVFTNIKDGNVGGWGFSMDSIMVSFVNNSLSGSGFGGKIKLPIQDGNLGYWCSLSTSNQGLKSSFHVETGDTIDVKMWCAKLKILPGSGISVEGVKNDVTVAAILNGDLTIDKKIDQLKNVNVKIPGAHFEKLTFMNKAPYVTVKTLSLASPNKFFAGFPIVMDPNKGEGFRVDSSKKNQGISGLRVAFRLNLDGKEESSICAGTAFTLWAKVDKDGNGIQQWNLQGADLNKIMIDVDIAAVKMDGEIVLYKGDEKYGDGFRGAINATIPSLATIGATVQFGSTSYQSNSVYRYWYVDAMFKMANGSLPIAPGLGLAGIGGGVYYHMKSPKTPEAASLKGDPEDAVEKFNPNSFNKSATGVEYIPDPSTSIGVKAKVFLVAIPSAKAFNGDIDFEIAFHNNGSLKFIHLGGNGYFISTPDPAKREANPLVSGSVDFNYYADEKIFEGKISVFINLKSGKKNILVGGGDCKLYFSPDKWYLKIGEPKKRISVNVLDIATVQTYLMVGKNSLPGIPPLPAKFQQKLPGFSNPRDYRTETGSGFAHGLQIDISTGELKFLIFYAEIAITFGYDVSIVQKDVDCEEAEGGKMGINGWYATGQVYASMTADVGIDIDVWFLKAKMSLLSVGAYAALQAGLPNPTWLKGAVHGEYSLLNGLLSGSVTFKFTWGKKCDEGTGDPFGGLKIISDMTPGNQGGVSVYTRPEAAFSLPVSTANSSAPITIETFDDEGNKHFKTFRFFVKDFTLINNKTKSEVPGEFVLMKNKQGAVYSPKEELAEKVSHTAKCMIRGERWEANKWVKITKNSNSNTEHLEVEERTFTTGNAPDRILNSNVIHTIPPRMMRYYTWRTSGSAMGEVRFNMYPSSVVNAKPESNKYEYKDVARVQRVGAGSVVVGENPIEWMGNAMNSFMYKLPVEKLTPETIYIVQFVRKRVLKAGYDDETEKKDKMLRTTGSDTMTQKKARLDAINLGENEILLYQIAFRTSKYRHFGDKLASYGISSSKRIEDNKIIWGTGSYNSTMSVELTGDEPLDYYDLTQRSYKFSPSETRYINPTFNVYGKEGAGKWWKRFYNEYSRYLDTSFMRNYLPTITRDYPPSDAYPSGSRLTNGTDITNIPLPKLACDWSYTGNGKSKPLTSAEINSEYWHNMGTLDEGNGLMGGFDLQAQEQAVTNTIRIRYDVATTIRKDRAKVWDKFEYAWSCNNSGFGNSTIPPSFEYSNAPEFYASNTSNPNYWDMRVRKGYYDGKFPMIFEYSFSMTSAGLGSTTLSQGNGVGLELYFEP